MFLHYCATTMLIHRSYAFFFDSVWCVEGQRTDKKNQLACSCGFLKMVAKKKMLQILEESKMFITASPKQPRHQDIMCIYHRYFHGRYDIRPSVARDQQKRLFFIGSWTISSIFSGKQNQLFFIRCLSVSSRLLWRSKRVIFCGKLDHLQPFLWQLNQVF